MRVFYRCDSFIVMATAIENLRNFPYAGKLPEPASPVVAETPRVVYEVKPTDFTFIKAVVKPAVVGYRKAASVFGRPFRNSSN